MIKPVPRAGDRPPDAGDADQPAGAEDAGGEAACWAHLVCPECGAITSEGHQDSCVLAAQHRDEAR
jgi:hypothetical protein